MIPAHPDRPPAPHDVWSAWHPDPLLVAALVLAAWAYAAARRRDRRAVEPWRAWCFAGALGAVAVALLSPLDAVSGALASAHMVQHLLLVLVAAPLLAVSAPWTAVWRAAPAAVHRATGRWRRRLRLTGRNAGAARHPAAVWLLYVGTLWFWHGSVPYGAALRHEAVHVVEHATFLGTAVLLWSVVVDARRGRRMSPGLGVLLVFATATQSVFLSVLLTFARTPWYSGYAATTQPWGLDPLADQQLAGVVMWIPGGFLYLATAMALLVAWIRQGEPADGQAVP